MAVQTVLGSIPADQLGITACHEHVLWYPPDSMALEDADLGLNSIPAAVAELRYYKSVGGGTLVEMTTEEIGRSPLDLAQISQATGVHIIAVTGHHKAKFSAEFLQNQSVEQIAERIIREITLGIADTGVRAGVIKAASSLNHAAEVEKRVIRAAGIAHRQTGAPVSTHTEAGTFALEQAELLLEAGVPPRKLLIGHLDRNLPREVYFQLAQRGVFLGFDQIGKEQYWPDDQRAILIRDLIEAGYVRQILLSSDRARKSSWKVHNPQTLGLGHILLDFVPRLKKVGVEEQAITTLLVENPAHFLDF
ncbi:MAG: phosphotriesterase-related protein [Chloroflexota bacterium]|nr:MAG: phosphotriesterase [Bellilinea sp.]